jgi:hypothetical protein
VSKSHSACRNYSCACWIHSRECCNYICAFQDHTACGNYTMRVEITLCVWKLHSACKNHNLRVEIAFYVYKSHSCVLKSHFAFRNFTLTCVHHNMRVNITHKSHFYTQSIIITFVSVIITLIRVNITLCVLKSQSYVS